MEACGCLVRPPQFSDGRFPNGERSSTRIRQSSRNGVPCIDTFFQLREECDAGVIGAVYLAILLRFEKAIDVELLAEDLSFFGCAHPADERAAS